MGQASRWKLACTLSLLLWGVAAKVPPGLLEEAILDPAHPQHVKVAIGQSKFMRYTCFGDPADIVISMASYSEKADPIMFLSMDPDEPPTILRHHTSSVDQWREDSVGNHYVLAQAVGPHGGIIGLANHQNFAAEELNVVLRIHCVSILAFDAIFWDHLRSSHVCPVGGVNRESPTFCSGHGHCEKHGVCRCAGDFTGVACSHKKSDLVVESSGSFRASIPVGQYQYFRIRIPPHFAGGYLQVNVSSDVPLVLLIRSDGLPTKTRYDDSNFDSWISHENTSSLAFYVKSPRGHQPSPDDLAMVGVAKCGNFGFGTSTCRDYALRQCEASCRQCLQCVHSGSEDSLCDEACNLCKAPPCRNKLASCAGNTTCASGPVVLCERVCGSCMACLDRDSNDPACSQCDCCSNCFPAAAKCGFMAAETREYTPYVYVGILNHRRFFNNKENVTADITLALREEPDFPQDGAHYVKSWFAELNDPFHDLRYLDVTQRQLYPSSERFVYQVKFDGRLDTPSSGVILKPRLYRDRLTMLQFMDLEQGDAVELKLRGGANITHILSSSNAAPKTVFDFDEVHLQPFSMRMVSNRRPGLAVVAPDGTMVFDIISTAAGSVWCVLFGGSDASVDLEARRVHMMPNNAAGETFAEEVAEIESETAAIACACLVALCCGLFMVISAAYGAERIGDRVGIDTSVPVTERFVSLLHGQQSATDRMTSVMRSLSFSGDIGYDVAEEDRYLQRGGWGDDGI